MRRAALTALALLPTPVFADFVENNLLAIFYHELGHAVIDQMQVPIFGQEEDAADALSILLIDALYDSESAEAIAYDAAALFWVEAEQEPAFWDVHGPDEQRFYNTVCLFYGADPDAREDFAQELGLPDERAESCEDEFLLASDSWNGVLDEMMENSAYSQELSLSAKAPLPIIQSEIEALNQEFNWPQKMTVHIKSCGEANAFYDLEDQSITMCSELADWLTGLDSKLSAN
ncbi:DUF4344 domain-containing metallopeptidase [Planktotalea sp.]|uniref:DUF4344 domain-containing metallopeptidase n=1 Tax=Planktotalea sp. TaxID=2029877 RepID=UPI003D6AEA70